MAVLLRRKGNAFCNICIAYSSFSEQQSNKFFTGFSAWKHIHQRIDEHESYQKHHACVEAYLRFSSSKTILDLLAVSQTSLRNQQIMQRRQILDRLVSIVKMIGKREMSYRETGSSEEVHTLINEKINHGTFLKTVFLLVKYDNVLKCHLDNITKKSLQKKTGKHNRVNRNTFISKIQLTLLLKLFQI